MVFFVSDNWYFRFVQNLLNLYQICLGHSVGNQACKTYILGTIFLLNQSTQIYGSRERVV